MTETMDDNVQTFSDITGLADKTVITNALKNNAGDVTTIINQYFEDPSGFSSKYSTAWNEELFAADREGNVDNNRVSFRIDAPDSVAERGVIGATPPPNFAPSRPPSRTNNRSPLGKAVDWTAMDITAAPNSRAQEEEDMARALRESAQEAGIDVPAQESGITSTTSPYFGQPRQNEYDQNNWSMVSTTGNRPIFPTIRPASFRKRDTGTPALLQLTPSVTDDDNLGGLLTILHEIPMSRNAFLSLGTAASDYGRGEEWWNGKAITTSEQQIQGDTQGFPSMQDVGEELHRIMAFLDKTERAYGSASCLIDMMPHDHEAAERRLFEVLKEAKEPSTSHMYTNAVIIPYDPTIAAAEAEELSEESSEDDGGFGLIEMETPEDSSVSSLYDVMDHLMWSDVLNSGKPSSSARMATFRNIGEVITLKLKQRGPPRFMDIPEVFYPERYTESRKEEARKIQHELASVNGEIADISLLKTQLGQWVSPVGEASLDTKESSLQRLTEQWNRYHEYKKHSVQWRVMQESKYDTTRYPDYRSVPMDPNEDEKEKLSEINDVLIYLAQQQSNKKNQAEFLEQRLEKLQRWRGVLREMLTDPNKPRPKPMTCNKYLLRGLVAGNNVVYVCQRQNPESSDTDTNAHGRDQWWRLYCPSAQPEQPFKAEKMDFKQVSESIWKDTRIPLLVYATENAVNAERAVLSAPLEQFITAENAVFRRELETEESSGAVADIVVSEPMSPSKRKHRADSVDSMASNRASIGSDDRDLADIIMGRGASDGNDDRALADIIMGRGESGFDMDEDEEAPPLPKRQSPSTAPGEDMASGALQTEPALPPRPSKTSHDAETGAREPEMQEIRAPSLFPPAPTMDTKGDDVLANSDLDMDISRR